MMRHFSKAYMQTFAPNAGIWGWVNNYILQFTVGCDYLYMSLISASGTKVLICIIKPWRFNYMAPGICGKISKVKWNRSDIEITKNTPCLTPTGKPWSGFYNSFGVKGTVFKIRATRMPAFWRYPLSPHGYPYYWFISDPKSNLHKVKITNWKNLPKLQILGFCKTLYLKHTFWSCLIRCINISNGSSKYCWRHRADTVLSTGPTDGQGETSIPLSTSLKLGV